MYYILDTKQATLRWDIFKGVSDVHMDFSRMANMKVFLVGHVTGAIPLQFKCASGVITADIPVGLPVDNYDLSALWIVDKAPHHCGTTEKDYCGRVARAHKELAFAITDIPEKDNTKQEEPIIEQSTFAVNYGYDGLSAWEMAYLAGRTEMTEKEWMDVLQESVDLVEEIRQARIVLLALMESKPVTSEDLDNVFVDPEAFTFNVRYSEQTLTMAEQSQARENVGAASKAEHDFLVERVDNIEISGDSKLGLLANLNPDLGIDPDTQFAVDAINAVDDKVNTFDDRIGNLDDLLTTRKDSLVNAANELKTDIGNKDMLITSNKSNLVNAINEHEAEIGKLSELTTTEKQNLVKAINEHDAEIGDISTFAAPIKNCDDIVEALNLVAEGNFKYIGEFNDWAAFRAVWTPTRYSTDVYPMFAMLKNDYTTATEFVPAGSIVWAVDATGGPSAHEGNVNWHLISNHNKVGNADLLTTTKNDNLVNAINEHDKEIGDQTTLPTYAQNSDGSFTSVFDALKNISEKNLPTDILSKTALHINGAMTYAQFNADAIKLQEAEMYEGAVVSRAYRITDGWTDANDVYHQANGIMYATTRESKPALGKYVYTWFYLENVDGKLGDLEELDPNIIDTNLVSAINATYERADDAYVKAEEALIKSATALRIRNEISWAQFKAEPIDEDAEEIEDEDGNKYVVPRIYRIYDAITLDLGGGIEKYYNANSLVYATAKTADGKYDWKYAENADGKLGDLSLLNTYIINADGTITTKKRDLVEAINANNQLIGKVEGISQDNLKTDDEEELSQLCIADIVKNIISKVGAMSSLSEYEKDTLSSGIVSSLKWIGTKAEQDAGIAMEVDADVDTLINAVNTLSNWLGNPKRFDGVWGDGTKDITSVLYEVISNEALNHLEVMGRISFAEFTANHKDAATEEKGNTYIITDDFKWEVDGKETTFKAGSWMYLYSAVSGVNTWSPINNGGGNDYIYIEATAKPTTDIRTDVIYVIPNDENKKECWLCLDNTSTPAVWLKISAAGGGDGSYIGMFAKHCIYTGATKVEDWDDLKAQDFKVLKQYLNNFVTNTKGEALKDGIIVGVSYDNNNDGKTDSDYPNEAFEFKGQWIYLEGQWEIYSSIAQATQSVVGVVKLATQQEYQDKNTSVAVTPDLIASDLENYYKKTEVDDELDKKADKDKVYEKTETYTKEEVDDAMKALTRSAFVSKDPTKMSPAEIDPYLGYTLFFGNDTDGYNMYQVDSTGVVKLIGKLSAGEGAFVKTDDKKYMTLSDIRTKDDDGDNLTIQMQIDAKQGAIPSTSAISNVLDAALTSKRALISNTNGKLAVSKVTDTELSYLEGAKSNIQDQIDNISSGTAQSGWNIGDVKMSMRYKSIDGDWLLCDGSAYKIEDYRDLYDIIQRSFSESDLDATLFRVPDMRGRVPEGLSSTGSQPALTSRKIGAETKKILRTDLPNSTIYTETDDTNYDGRHGHARGDFNWYSPGGHTHNFGVGGGGSSKTQTGGCDTGYTISYDKASFKCITQSGGGHTHYKDANNGTSISSSATPKHQHKIKLNGGVTQTELNVMQPTLMISNFYIKWK